MQEYRRFISYFYEYIDGKKQKNAGFAKVELRNGIWRILFRIITEVFPGPPIRVYGFVREADSLRGILLGELRPVQQIAEEWAFRADAAIGGGSYTFGNLAGIWIESGDGRRFITAWDDGEISVERFVTESESPDTEAAHDQPQAEAVEETVEEAQLDAPEFEAAEAAACPGPDVMEEAAARPASEVMGEAVACPAADVMEEAVASPGAEMMGEAAACPAAQEQEEAPTGTGCREADIPERARSVIEEMFRKRAVFQPFADKEIRNCVMILPCDIVRLQQENWNVGRSSFLQHGFHLYRHLLLGKKAEGTYILGVPGLHNPQEAYMARMFGYERFRGSADRDGRDTFGYWCRELRHM